MLTTITAECRPNLRACNFFIRSSVLTFTDASLDIKEHSILINCKTQTCQLHVHLPSNVILQPKCSSGLNVTTNSISFRGQIGQFFPITANALRPMYAPDFKSEDAIKLSCAFCLEPISDYRNFSRILPLPSTEDVGDFFCHRHSNERISLNPATTDFFYNFFFYKVNVSCIKSAKTNSSFKCAKCCAELGEVQDTCVKLWSSVVQLIGTTVRSQTVLERFIESFKYFVNDLPVQMNKLVFTSAYPSNDNSYTLVTVLDRKLALLSTEHRSNDETCQLECKMVMKIMYSHSTESNRETEEWVNSYNSSVVPIHPAVEELFLKYLAIQSEKIPENFRSVNGFCLSYIL